MMILTYLAKVLVCSGLLYVYYYFFLRNQNHHQYNRIFLLFLPILSFVLPLLKLPVGPEQSRQGTVLQSLPSLNVSEWEKEIVVSSTASAEPFQWLPIVGAIIYALGTIAVLVPFVCSLRELLNMIRLTPCEWVGKTRLLLTDIPGTPFSFFSTIYWNKSLLISTAEGQQIFRHELYHIQNRHSLDIIYLEILRGLMWINPIFHLVRKEIDVVHEFLADEHVAKEDPSAYAELLIKAAISEKKNKLSHSFYSSPFKRRITMITKINKRSFSNLRKLALLPLVLFLFSAFAEHQELAFREGTSAFKTDTIPQSDFKKSEIVTVVAYAEEKPAEPAKEAGQTKAPAQAQKPVISDKQEVEKAFTKVEIEPAYPGGVQAWMRFLTRTFRYPEEARKRNIEGFVVVQFIVEKDGTVRNVQAISGPETGGLREEAVSVIERSGKWLPAVQKGKKVTAYKKQPVTFKLQKRESEAK